MSKAVVNGKCDKRGRKQAAQYGGSSALALLRRISLTPYGRQHNVAYNSENLHRVKQMLHLDFGSSSARGLLNRFD